MIIDIHAHNISRLQQALERLPEPPRMAARRFYCDIVGHARRR